MPGPKRVQSTTNLQGALHTTSESSVPRTSSQAPGDNSRRDETSETQQPHESRQQQNDQPEHLLDTPIPTDINLIPSLMPTMGNVSNSSNVNMPVLPPLLLVGAAPNHFARTIGYLIFLVQSPQDRRSPRPQARFNPAIHTPQPDLAPYRFHQLVRAITRLAMRVHRGELRRLMETLGQTMQDLLMPHLRQFRLVCLPTCEVTGQMHRTPVDLRCIRCEVQICNVSGFSPLQSWFKSSSLLLHPYHVQFSWSSSSILLSSVQAMSSKHNQVPKLSFQPLPIPLSNGDLTVLSPSVEATSRIAARLSKF